MAEHKHGSMNIEVQEQTFASFMKFVVRAVVVIFFILLFLAVFNS